jgi:hypothetical protein
MAEIYVTSTKAKRPERGMLGAICESLQASRSDPVALTALISQFLSLFELSCDSVRAICRDPLLPNFLQGLNGILSMISVPRPHEGEFPAIVTEILTFLNAILVMDPTALDQIAAASDLDLIIPQFFASNLLRGEIIEEQCTHLFLPIKFIALVASSKRVQLTTTTGSDMLIQVCSGLLNNAQLAAWAGACIAGLCRNCPPFLAIVKLHPLSRVIRAKLAALLPSSDPCVVVSSLAATVALFSLGPDQETALAASLKYVTEDSPFPLAAQLCSWTILSLIQKVSCSTRDLEQLLEIPLTATGIRLHTIYQLLCHLVDLRYRFGRPDQLKAIALSVVTCESGFAAIAGCHFLLLVSESNPGLLAGVDEKGHLMKRALRRLNELSGSTDTELAEAIVMEMRLLIDSSGIPERILGMLVDQEEFLFLNFVRQVENNQAFLSVAWFSLLVRCSSDISRWALRIKRILIDSQFPALLVHVLTSSLNRRAVSDAVRALEFFMNNCELSDHPKDSFFFDAAVSGFIVINQKKNETASVATLALERDRHELSNAVHNLQVENTRLERDIGVLQTAIGQEKDRVRATTDRASRSAQDNETYQQQITDLQDRLLQASLRAKEKKTKLKQSLISLNELHTQNIQLQELVKRLEGVEVENRSVKKNNHLMEARIQELEGQLTQVATGEGEIRGKLKLSNQELHEREEALLELQRKCSDCQARNDAQQTLIATLTSEKKELAGQIGELESEVSGERLRNAELSDALANLEAANLEVHSRLTMVKGHIGKDKEKKTVLKQRVTELQREKRRWESIAKFVHKVGEVKGDAVETVFGSLGIEP